MIKLDPKVKYYLAIIIPAVMVMITSPRIRKLFFDLKNHDFALSLVLPLLGIIILHVIFEPINPIGQQSKQIDLYSDRLEFKFRTAHKRVQNKASVDYVYRNQIKLFDTKQSFLEKIFSRHSLHLIYNDLESDHYLNVGGLKSEEIKILNDWQHRLASSNNDQLIDSIGKVKPVKTLAEEFQEIGWQGVSVKIFIGFVFLALALGVIFAIPKYL